MTTQIDPFPTPQSPQPARTPSHNRHNLFSSHKRTSRKLRQPPPGYSEHPDGYNKGTRMGAAIAFPGFVVTLASFILLLLTTLSVPIIKSIYFLRIQVNLDSRIGGILRSSINPGDVTLGTLGYCSSGIASISTPIGSTPQIGPSGCTNAKLGYSLPVELFDRLDDVRGLDLSRTGRVVVKGLSCVLVLWPIATGFTGLVLLCTFFAWCGQSRGMEITAFALSWFALFSTWLAWIITITLFAIAKNRLSDWTDGVLKGDYGNAMWMGLAACILLSFTICLTCCGMFGHYKKPREETTREGISAPMTQTGNGLTSGRRRFWNLAEKRDHLTEENRRAAASPAPAPVHPIADAHATRASTLSPGPGQGSAPPLVHPVEGERRGEGWV